MSDDITPLVEQVTRALWERLGKAPPDLVQAVVSEVARDMEHSQSGTSRTGIPQCVEQEKRRVHERAILTTTGRIQHGIVARVTQAIADAGGDILDISQTRIADYVTMILVIDLGQLDMPFADFKERVIGACRDLDLQAMIMHEDVAPSLQRL